MKSKAQKREEAVKRNEKWASKSLDEKLRDLSTRTGCCVKELERLAPGSGVAMEARQNLWEVMYG
jgi:hypothetical protein